jgi:ribosome-binding factor A
MRVVRINELVKREISSILHTRYRETAVRITISEVETSPDLKDAVVYYGVIGDRENEAQARRFFAKDGGEIRMMLGKRVVMKYLPRLDFRFDDSMERGARVGEIIDSLGLDEDKPTK